MLATEGLGTVEVAPGGRWLVFERQVPFETTPPYELDAADVRRARLYLVDLAHPAMATPLMSSADGREGEAGMIMLGFSPKGTRLAIGRLDGDRWTLGVVTLATRAVRWFDIAPDYSPFRPTLAWLSEDALVTLAAPDATPPWVIRRDREDEVSTAALWENARAGKAPTVTAIGSGRYEAVTPPAPPVTLVHLEVVTGKKRQLAKGNFETLSLSPRGRHVALTEADDSIQVTTPAPIRQSDDLRRRRLRLVDLANGETWTPCRSCDLPFVPPVWAPVGEKLLFFARPSAGRWATGTPWVADPARRTAAALALHGVAPEIITQRGTYDGVALGWMGNQPMLFGRSSGSGARADWYAFGRKGASNLTAGLAQASARLATGSAAVMLTAHAAWRLGPGRPQLLLGGVDSMVDGFIDLGAGAKTQTGSPHFVAWRHIPTGIIIDVPGQFSVPLVADAASTARPVAVSIARKAVVVEQVDPSGVSLLLVAAPGAPPRPVAVLNEGLRDVDVSPPIAIRHAAPPGATVTSWLYLPARQPGAAKPPLIVIPYAGSVYGDTAPALWNPGVGRTYTNVSALVGHGYAVLLPSMPDLAASDRHPFDFAGQVLAAVDAVIARGLVDPQKLGLWGHSYGGYTGATIATETDRFKAIVVSSGIYDLAAFEGSFAPPARRQPGYGLGILPWAGWTETGQPHLGATPSGNPPIYTTNSPVYRANRIVTPMLIIGSDRDFIGIDQAEQLFSALYRQGKDAEMLSYWGESHVLMSPANVRDGYARVFAWFDRHFAPAAPAPPEPRP